MLKPTALVMLTMMLTACAPQPDTAPTPPELPMENACGAADLQNLVGQSASVLETMRFGQTTRILRPDMAVTMDFLAERLNIRINAAEKIESVTCG